MKDETQEQRIIVKACKYDGSEHRRWPARILSFQDGLLILNARFEEEVQHQLLGVVERGTVSIEYYWLNRWYNVFRFLKSNGELRNFYCNINIPPTFDGRVLRYVDLDIDILVEADFSYRIVDEDEFEVNAARYGYSASIRQQTYQALADIVTLIKSREFPFHDLR